MTREIYCTWTICHIAKAPVNHNCAECSQRVEYDPDAASERKARAEKKGERDGEAVQGST